MPTLINTCIQLRAGLQKVKTANQTRQEISALQQRMREWSQHASTRQTLAEKTLIVDPNLLALEDIAQADAKVKVLAEQAKKLLEDGCSLQALAVDNLWGRLTSAAELANEVLKNAARDKWREFVESFGNVESPSILEGRMLKTPANETILGIYKQNYAKYLAAVRADLPANASTYAELADTVETLQGLREKLKDTAPEAVRLFFKAIDNGGAALELVTPEVIDWLRKNHDPSQFVVKSRANLSWR